MSTGSAGFYYLGSHDMSAIHFGINRSAPLARFPLPVASPIASASQNIPPMTLDDETVQEEGTPDALPTPIASTIATPEPIQVENTPSRRRADTAHETKRVLATIGEFAGGAQLRASPGISSKCLEILPAGSTISVVEQGERWAKVQSRQGNVGFVHVRLINYSAQMKTE